MWWTIDRNLTLEQTKLSAMATYLDSIKNGVTTVFDHHASFGHITGSLFAIEEAAKELGVRTWARDGKYGHTGNYRRLWAGTRDSLAGGRNYPGCP